MGGLLLRSGKIRPSQTWGFMWDREIRREIKRCNGPLRQANWAFVFVCHCSAKDQMFSVRWKRDKSVFRYAENGLMEQRQQSSLDFCIAKCPLVPQAAPSVIRPRDTVARPWLKNVAVMTNADCSALPVLNEGIPRQKMTASPCLLVCGGRARGGVKPHVNATPTMTLPGWFYSGTRSIQSAARSIKTSYSHLSCMERRSGEAGGSRADSPVPELQ